MGFIQNFAPTLSRWDSQTTADAWVVGVESTEDGPRLLAGQDHLANIEPMLKDLGVTGSTDHTVRIPAPEGSPGKILVLVGVGHAEKPAPQGTPPVDRAERLRRSSGAAVRSLAGKRSAVLSFGVNSPEDLAAVAEGAAMGAYTFTTFKSLKSKSLNSFETAKADTAGLEAATNEVGSAQAPDQEDHNVKHPVAEILIEASVTENLDEILGHASAVAQGVNIVKDLVNTPASNLYPESFADTIAGLAREHGVEVEIWDKSRLEQEGCGGILGVGQGSARDPRMVKLTYSPAEAADSVAQIALVGKGITFDTGGISLKPASSMMTMKLDMAGAATVAAVLATVARLKLPVAVTGWLALAENMPSATSVKPSDVVTIRNGQTVEIMNTDAEGRVVMADALVAAAEESPAAIVDIATLTGAQMVALGNRTTGVLGHSEVREQLVDAAEAAGELVWPMPIPENQRASLDSRIADISNMGDKFGGMLTAAAFLRDFVGDIPWAHLDIAGPAFNEGSAWGYTPQDATGVMVRTLVRFIADRS